MRNIAMLTAVTAVALTLPVFSQGLTAEPTAHSEFINAKGEPIGRAQLTETKEGVLIQAQAKGLPEGWHGFHIHSVGQCQPGDFKSAGGHYNPEGKQHGYENPAGAHEGDLPNVYVDKDGVMKSEVIAEGVSLKPGAANSLLDKDGSAIVIHQSKDDYKSNPAGQAGDRLSCAVIKK